MRGFFKWFFLILILVIVGSLLCVRFSMGMSLPEGQPGPEADKLAMKMMDRIGNLAWKDTRFVTWTFSNRNTYIWDRSRSLVYLRNGENEIVLNTLDHSGWAKENGKLLSGDEQAGLLESAWSNFCNDSFWLIGPLKVMDTDVTRSIVKSENGDALLVRYNSGGVSPGDSYLWYLREDGLPISYRMWVGILPIPGLEVTWEDWTSLHTGTSIAQRHMLGPLNISITGLKSGSELEDLGLEKNPFTP